MSVLIKGMEMPDRCLNCPMYDEFNYHCKLYSFGIPARYNYENATRPEWCELVGLPEKHGRLFDANEVKKCINKTVDSDIKAMAIALLEWAIDKRWCIEAEGAEE